MKKTHLFAAIAFVAAPLMGEPFTSSAAAEPQRGQQARPRQDRQQMRFRAMDTNNDGMITRAEWRGNARAFDNHDWNRDGVLSGNEVRPAGQRDDEFWDWTVEGFRSLDTDGNGRISRNEWTADLESFRRADRNRDDVLTRQEFLGNDMADAQSQDRFDELDRNNNNRIERREWNGTAEAFDWLDRNNDGWLSRAETVDNDANTADARLGRRPLGTSGRFLPQQVVIVDAQRRWTDTGIDVREGDRIEISAEGRITLSGNANSGDAATAEGSVSGRRAAQAPIPDMPAGGLVVRIGDEAPLYAGRNQVIASARTSGRLYLTVNDDYLGDNQGQFRVSIRVNR
jgi:Ca2+-binding EF-hand superfamily protein